MMKFERLGDIITIKKGKKPLFSDLPSTESIRVLQIDDLRNDNNIKYTDEKTGVFANEEDILLAWDGANAGTIGYGKKGYIGSTIALLRKNIPENHSTIFIGKFLQSQFDYLRSKSTGATIPHIDGKSLRDLTIPKIPLSDQIRIAQILSQAESLIAQRKQSISLLDELLKSTFLEMFGDPMKNEKKWETQSLGHISDVGSSKRVFVEELGDEGVPFFRGTEIGKLAEGINIIPTLFITQGHYEQLKTHTGIPKAGDLLMPSICPDGRIWRITDDKPFYFKDGRVLWISLKNSKINGTYLQCVLKEIFKSNYNNIASGTTFAELKIFALKNIKTPVPPIDLQTKFANIVEKVEALKTQYQQSLTELQNMYGVLSQKAFKGELSLDKKKIKENV